jgi:conjugative relaxase-like TrwC/TraI family protein
VITVHPLGRSPQIADYYLSRQACDDLGYYHRPHAVPGRWIGSGARALGLAHDFDNIDADMLRGFLAGRGLDGAELVPPVTRRDERGQPYDARRVGFDITFSAPKSVSVLYGVASPEVAMQVALAHHAAVDQAMEVFERLSARAARGHQGDGQRARRIATSGLIGAAFDHDTSRLLDPQLQTHVVLANLVQGVNGRWSALDSQTMVRQATTVSHLYQAVLRAELTRRLGVAWTSVERGTAEVEGLPRTVLRAFSKRRDQIERALEDRRLSGTAAAQAACLATRPAKQHEDPAVSRERWRAEAGGLGVDADAVRRLLDRTAPPPSVDRDALASAVLGPEGVTRDRSTFDRGRLIREVCQHLPVGADVTANQILTLSGELLRDDDVVPVVTGDGPAYTTVKLLAVEQQALDRVTAREADNLAVVPDAVVDAAIASGDLRDDQVELVRAITGSGRGVETITGPAGSGKTRALAATADAWGRCGIPVRGVAVAAITADGLQQATGAPSTSLARLLSEPARHIPAGGVLLLDEAGMVGTRQLARLTEITRAVGCKLVLVGDPAQLPEMEAGGLFDALTHRTDAIALTGHHRQVEAWEAGALEHVREGRMQTAFDAYADHGRIHTADTIEAVREQLVDDYLSARAEHDDPRQVLILARTRSQAATLNHEVGRHLLTDGRLSAVALRVRTDDREIDFRVGDEVIVTRDLHHANLFNGTRATVTSVSFDGLVLTTATGRPVPLDRVTVGRALDHGYALTIHTRPKGSP